MLKLNITQYTTGQSFMEINLDHSEMTELKHLLWSYGYMWYGEYTTIEGEQGYGLVTTLSLLSEALVKVPTELTPTQVLKVKQE